MACDAIKGKKKLCHAKKCNKLDLRKFEPIFYPEVNATGEGDIRC